MASSIAATGLPQYMGSPPTPWRDGDDRCSSPFPEKIGNFPDDESDSHFEFMEESPTRPALVRRRAEQLSQQRRFMSKFVAKDQTLGAFLRVNREGLHRIPQRSFLEVYSQGEKPSDASPPRSDASRSSTTRPAWIPPDAAYVEISDDESDKDLCPPASDLDRGMTVPQVQMDDQDASMPSTNTSEDERMDSSDDEAGGSVSPFSSASLQETPRTEVSDDALADSQRSPKFIPNNKSTEDIVFAVRDVIRGASSRKPESSSGYVYVLYDPSEESPFYKIGQSKDVERRTKQHNANCRLGTWTTRKSPKCTNLYKTLEKLALAELKNLKYEPNCSCPTQHREYSWGEVADGLKIVRSWSRWLTEEEPFDNESNLKPFWADRLEAFTCGNLGSFNCMKVGCTKEAEEPQACQACLREGWMTFTEPTSEDRFEYICRIATSSRWVCWVLQTCHKRFPSYETRLASLVNWIILGQQLWDSVSSIQLILVTLFIRGIYVTALACWNHGIDKSEFLDLFLDLFLAVIAAYRLFLVGTPTAVPGDEKPIRRVNGSRSPSRQFERTASKSPGQRNPGSNRPPKKPRPSKASGAEGENKVNSPNKEHSDEMKELPGEMLPASPLTPDRSLTRQTRKKGVRTG